jgi:hypothetical protein
MKIGLISVLINSFSEDSKRSNEIFYLFKNSLLNYIQKVFSRIHNISYF